MPRLTDEKWLDVQTDYEVYPDMSLRAIASKHGVGFSSISERAKKYGWRRDTTGKALALAKARSEQQANILPNKKEQAIEEYAGKLFDIMERHKTEWEAVRLMVAQAVEFDELGNVTDLNFDLSKSAKITSETLKILQDGERKAWGIEMESPKIQINTQVNAEKKEAEEKIDWSRLSDSELETIEKILTRQEVKHEGL